jgi:ABC-type transport system involved in multi-copper enzyme maturation permease subunit
MNAQATTIDPVALRATRRTPFLGFGTVFQKELTEWFRGPRAALIILGISVLGAIFLTLIPFIAETTKDAEAAGLLTKDPTANVLLGWTGQTVTVIAVLATMALLSSERDRGTLAWTLTNPVSPTSVIAAKFAVAVLVLITTAVLIPMAVSVGLATAVYGIPDLRVIGTFTALFLALPLFYVALTVAIGTAVKSTGGVAAIAFAVILLPAAIGGLVPLVAEISPTAIGMWAMQVAKGQPASMLTPIAWLVSMIVLLVGAKVVFDREEL